ncbi:MAG: hypothetical protein IV100_23075, partial [Myxococcales bacterium]|nr:hypothetical protein [Myxococcales bacterium]
MWLIIFPGLLWGVPGYLASRWCLPRASALERVATSALFGSSLVVPLAYIVPYVTRQPLTPIWVVAAAALVAAVFGALLRFRPREPATVALTPGHEASQDWRVVLGVTAIIVVVAFTSIPRSFEAVEVFSPCPHQASMFLLEDGSGSGLETWDPLWQTRVAHVTEHASEPGFGLGKILTIQRIGSAATLVQHFAFHGSGGLVVASFTYFGIGALFSALLLAQWLRSRALVVALTAITLIAYRLGGAYMVNENLLAASLITGVLWLVLRHRQGHSPGAPLPSPDGPLMALAGIVYAHAVGTRPELGLVLPALLLLARPWSVARFAVVGVVAALFLAPWLLTTYESFGQALYHPSLSRGAVPVSIFGFEVKFHPMNWPWNDTFVRPDTDPFPNLIMLPLENIAHFGVLFMALVLVGIPRVGARLTGLLTLYALPVYAVLLVIVNLDYDKLSYCVMSFGPLPYFAGAGLASLLDRPFSRKRLVAVAVALAALVGLPQLLRNVELPVDPRRQFNESRDPRHFRPVEEKLASLLSPTFVPMFDWPDAMAGLDWSLSLLWNGGPVHRGATEPAPGRLHFWCEQIPMVRTDRVALLDAPSLPPYASDPNDFELTKDYVPFAIALET